MIPAQRNVVLYLRSDPAPGNYNLTADGALDDVVIQQDISLDVSMLYTDTTATTTAFNPPPACELNSITITLELLKVTLAVTMMPCKMQPINQGNFYSNQHTNTQMSSCPFTFIAKNVGWVEL